MALLKQNDRLIASVPIENLAHWLDEVGHEEADYSIELEAQEQRSVIRQQISKAAGDNATLLGTTIDATQLLFYAFTSLIAKLNTATSLAQVREAAAPFADISTGFLSKVEDGEVKLPFMIKGLESVVSDIEQLATAVAEVLQSTTNGG
jgi:hypothetical protein